MNCEVLDSKWGLCDEPGLPRLPINTYFRSRLKNAGWEVLMSPFIQPPQDEPKLKPGLKDPSNAVQTAQSRSKVEKRTNHPACSGKAFLAGRARLP